MRSFILLLKIQLLGLFGINKALHADPKKAKRLLALGALAVLAIVAVAVVYSGGVAVGLVSLGLAEAVPLVAVLAGSVMGAVAAFLKANGVLFSFKDYDLVLSLPVPQVSVIMSRIASLYAMSAGFGLLVMVPAFVVYAGAVPVGAVAVIGMVTALLLAPLLPLSIAMVLAALIAAVSARFRHANILVVLLSMLTVVGIVAGSFALSGQQGDRAALSALGAQLSEQISSFYPPAAWATSAIVQGDLLSLATFAAVSLVAALVLIVVLTRVFVPVNELLKSTRPHRVFSFDAADGECTGADARARSPFKALLVKEARMLVATPIYFMNSCIGYVLVLVAAIAAVVARVLGMLDLSALPSELSLMVGTFLPWAVAFGIGISSTTAPSVSLEGSARWLMLTAPVPARTVLGAKAALNLLLAVPTIVVGGVLLAIAFPSDAVSVIALFVVPLSLALFATFAGLALDARHPRYDWTTVYEPVKRGLPVFGVVMGGMVVVALGIAATVMLGLAASLAYAVVVGAVSFVLYGGTQRKGLAA
ncbi:MAG: hypothetical protein RR934_06480 [Gordonibacter sp.]|uniref:putative ABC transporter permease subunit n=1 Tax=Gordonibacter sp. TaxID=1968902 RepID=UPI0032206EBB